jgi:hypothetical protein
MGLLVVSFFKKVTWFPVSSLVKTISLSLNLVFPFSVLHSFGCALFSIRYGNVYVPVPYPRWYIF